MIKYICDICGKEFTTDKKLRARNLYMGELSKIYTVDICSDCNRELDTRIAEVEYSFYKEKKEM